MIPSLRILGLAALTLLVSGALAASSAQAAAPEFHSEVQPVIVEGDQVVPLILTIELGLSAKCGTAHFKGTSTVKTSTTLSLEAEYTSCKFLGVAATLKMNTCTFLYHLVAGSNPPTATMDIVCPAGKKVELASSVLVCTVKIGGQTGLKHLTFSNTGAGASRDIDMNAIVAGITYEEVGSECPTPGVHTDGEYSGTATFKGYKDEGVKGAQVGIWVD